MVRNSFVSLSVTFALIFTVSGCFAENQGRSKKRKRSVASESWGSAGPLADFSAHLISEFPSPVIEEDRRQVKLDLEFSNNGRQEWTNRDVKLRLRVGPLNGSDRLAKDQSCTGAETNREVGRFSKYRFTTYCNISSEFAVGTHYMDISVLRKDVGADETGYLRTGTLKVDGVDRSVALEIAPVQAIVMQDFSLVAKATASGERGVSVRIQASAANVSCSSPSVYVDQGKTQELSLSCTWNNALFLRQCRDSTLNVVAVDANNVVLGTSTASFRVCPTTPAPTQPTTTSTTTTTTTTIPPEAPKGLGSFTTWFHDEQVAVMNRDSKGHMNIKNNGAIAWSSYDVSCWSVPGADGVVSNFRFEKPAVSLMTPGAVQKLGITVNPNYKSAPNRDVTYGYKCSLIVDDGDAVLSGATSFKAPGQYQICTSSQPAPEWGEKNGRCLQSCDALGGTDPQNESCESTDKENVGEADDTPYCCKAKTVAPPPPETGSGRLDPDKSLEANQYVTSKNGLYRLIFQGDGNLVLYYWVSESSKVARWDSGTSWNANGGRAIMQADGNLVVHNAAGQATWDSKTQWSGSYLELQDDGRLVIRSPTGVSVKWLH